MDGMKSMIAARSGVSWAIRMQRPSNMKVEGYRRGPHFYCCCKLFWW